MAEMKVQRQFPLRAEALAAPRGGPSIAMSEPLARFIFRGDAEAAKLCGGAFGLALPHEVCRASAAGARAALWLGPDEWLLLAPETERAILGAAMAQALARAPNALVDVSHRQIALSITGAHAADLLASHCMLDLDEGAFPAGMCTRTLFAKAEIVLWRKGRDDFHIEVWRSFAPYLAECLREASLDAGAD